MTTGPLAQLNNDPDLVFAYAVGKAAQDDDSDDAALVCVWDSEARPDPELEKTQHFTLGEFTAMLDEMEQGRGWEYPSSPAVKVLAAFSDGILLADDSGHGMAARARVIELPEQLSQVALERVRGEQEEVARQLESIADPFERTSLLLDACHRAYVALFAAGGHWYPGPAQREEYIERYFLNERVPEAEKLVWEASTHADDSSGDLAGAWRDFVKAVLD